jgi:ABC-type amino acid transport system permease subunit
MTLDFAAVWVEWPMLLRGLGMTVGLTVFAAALGGLLGASTR